MFLIFMGFDLHFSLFLLILIVYLPNVKLFMSKFSSNNFIALNHILYIHVCIYVTHTYIHRHIYLYKCYIYMYIYGQRMCWSPSFILLYVDYSVCLSVCFWIIFFKSTFPFEPYCHSYGKSDDNACEKLFLVMQFYPIDLSKDLYILSLGPHFAHYCCSVIKYLGFRNWVIQLYYFSRLFWLFWDLCFAT